MLEIWSKISNIGVRSEYEADAIRRIKLTNQLTAIIVCLYFLSGINNLSFGEYSSFLTLETISALMLLGFVFNFNSKHETATHFVLIANNLIITFFNFYTHISASVFIFYFPLILAVSFLIDFN